jgi:hypothetical protein
MNIGNTIARLFQIGACEGSSVRLDVENSPVGSDTLLSNAETSSIFPLADVGKASREKPSSLLITIVERTL